MSALTHDIRLVAGFEVTASPVRRVLERDQSERLLTLLADDLATHLGGEDHRLLVGCGALFEPGDLLRPGFLTWQALRELSRAARLDPETESGLLAIGAYQGRLPDARLRPPAAAPTGQLLLLPLSLMVSEQRFKPVRERLEQVLFERASLRPPTRALLVDLIGLETNHGQLMTLDDLLALHHVQMDSAGLSSFWAVVETILLKPDGDRHFDLPAGIRARFQAGAGRVDVDFVSFDQFQGTIDDYALWTRSQRSLTALLDLHGIEYAIGTKLTEDPGGQCWIEPAGPSRAPAGVSAQVHHDCGLIAWSVVEDGHQFNLYPRSLAAMQACRERIEQSGALVHSSGHGPWIDPRKHTLIPANHQPPDPAHEH